MTDQPQGAGQPVLQRPQFSLPRGSRSLGTKFFLLGLLSFLLCLPLLMVWALVADRERNFRDATYEIGRQWGGNQTLAGPFIAVPVLVERSFRDSNNTVTLRRVREEILIAPDDLAIASDVTTEERTRGIHTAVVYQTGVKVKASYSTPVLSGLDDSIVRTDWADARMILSLSDLKGIETANFSINGRAVTGIEPGLGGGHSSENGSISGFNAPLSGAFSDDGTLSAPLIFDIEIALRGSQTLSFVPAGAETQVTVTSTWPHPSFAGEFLPNSREISDQGFSASWTVSKLARPIAQVSLSSLRPIEMFMNSSFGVRFYQPVDFYRLVERAVKYGVLFVNMTFLIIFALEVMSGGRMHAVHYAMSGLMVVMFFVLLLALAEVFGFTLAYGLSAGATGAVLAGFAASVFGGRRATIGAFAGFALIYGLLYLVLRLEDAALLAGAVTGFVVLTAMMFASRKVDWSARPSEAATSVA